MAFRSAHGVLFGLSAVFGLVVIATAACGGSSSRSGFDGSSSGSTSSGGTSSSTSSTSSSSTSSSGFGSSGTDASTNQDGCSDEAKLVYVLSLEGDLYSFAPADKKFTKVGPLNCKSGDTTFVPISMAVDRNAIAWVNMRDELALSDEGSMFKVDTKTAACTPTAIQGEMGGMGFSTDDATTQKETLFVIGAGADKMRALLKVDFTANAFVPVADLQEDVDLELTGTGDGRLYGFLQSDPLALAAVDKTSSAFSGKVPLNTVPTPQAPMYAFSFWGGDFYFYTATSQSANKTTTVSHYKPSDGTVDNAYMTNIGFHIVGAGVSTCAPTTSPK